METIFGADPNQAIGGAQCCRTKGNGDVECTRRDPWNADVNDGCLTNFKKGQKDYITFFEAESKCANLAPIGEWELCDYEIIMAQDVCDGTGCNMDNQLAWTKIYYAPGKCLK